MKDAKWITLFASFIFSLIFLAMKIIETENFFKANYGWFCKRCQKRDKHKLNSQKNESTLYPARWLDASRKILICPKCGVTEEIDKT